MTNSSVSLIISRSNSFEEFDSKAQYENKISLERISQEAVFGLNL